MGRLFGWCGEYVLSVWGRLSGECEEAVLRLWEACLMGFGGCLEGVERLHKGCGEAV